MGSPKRKLIQFEINEIPWKVVNHYCSLKPQSTLAALLGVSYKYETVTPDTGKLSPWITWPTFHRGVNNQKHHIADLNQDVTEVNKTYPAVWELLKKNNVKTAVFGSLHTAPPPADYKEYAYFIPDPFSSEKTASPQYVEAFQEFSLTMSRGSARNVSGGINVKAGLNVMMKWPQLGFRPSTFGKIGKQLLDERKQSWKKGRRRTYQVVLAWDVFMKQLRQHQPEFTTFFSNHVASSMHRYWAAAFPEDYKTFNIDKDWVDRYKNEIVFTMDIFDGFLTELKKFVDAHPEYRLMLASSMGQAATNARMCETQLYMKNDKVFFNHLGLGETDYTQVPCMFPQYNVKVHANKIDTLRNNLRKISISGNPLVFREADAGFFSLELGQDNLKINEVVYNGQPLAFEKFGLENVEIEDKSATTAYHIPQGILMVYDPRDLSAKSNLEQIPSTAVAPNILQSFGVAVPHYMQLVPMQALAAAAGQTSR